MKKRRRPKKSFYEAIKNIPNKRVKEQILIDLQSHAYRSIINDDLKTLPIQISIPQDDDLYDIFKENYNQYIGMPIPVEYSLYISYIVPRKTKSIKKKKKNATRIKKEMIKMCRNGWLGQNVEATKKCIRDFESAIRESFIIIRRTVKQKAFDVLPQQVQLKDGTIISSDQYYIQSDISNLLYIQNENLSKSEIDRRFVQYQISEYIFFIVRRI